MKEGWKYKKLGEIATEMYRGSGIKRDQITSVGYPCIRYGEIYTTYNISFDECISHTTEEDISPRKYFEHGDLLFAITGESVEDIGKTIAYLGHNKCLLGGDIVCMKHKENPKYLAYALSSKEAIRQKGLGKTKLKVVHTNIPSLKEISIPVPPLSEQRAIVARLDSAFAQIDSLKANAEKQLSEARQLFQKALEEAMKPKEGWEEKTIGEIAEVKGGKRIPKGYKLESSDTGYKYIRVSDFTDDGTIDLANIQYISKEVYEQISRYTITDEDLYISIAGTIGKSGIIPSELNGANLTENACKLVFKTNINKKFVYFFTKSDLFMKQVSKATKQASQPKLALTRLAEIVISIPPLSTQHSIVAHLDSLSSNVRALEEKLRKMKDECDALKQAMLREIFE